MSPGQSRPMPKPISPEQRKRELEAMIAGCEARLAAAIATQRREEAELGRLLEIRRTLP